jgi:hypothetical protein
VIVESSRIELLGGPMSTKSNHSPFRHRAGVDPKRSALISHELDFGQIDSSIWPSAPQ